MKSKKTSRAAARPRRRTPAADYAAFTIVLEDIRAQFAVFGEALAEKASRSELHAVRDELREELASKRELYGVRDELRAEMHEMRDELRAEMHEMRDELRAEMREVRAEMGYVKTALIELSLRIPEK